MSLLMDIKGVSKKFHLRNKELTALDNISLNIYQGEYVAITGHSGSGKSTLLNLLALFDRPCQGEYLFDGTPTVDFTFDQKSLFRNSNIGVIFQAYHLIDELTVWENIELCFEYSKDKALKAKKAELIEESLKSVGLGDKKDNFPFELSGGEQQRVAIARAIVLKPKVILADEPTGNLDHENALRIIELLEALNKTGVTLIIVTHDLEFAKRAEKEYHLVRGVLNS